MKREKNKEKKHESTIGKIIYGFLLFMPLIAIFVKCGYTMFNKNAYQSYYGQTINQTENINVTVAEMQSNKTYYANIQAINTENSYTQTTFSVTSIKDVTTNIEYDMSIFNKLRFFKGSNTQIYTQLLRIDDGNSTIITGNHVIEFTYNGTIDNGTINSLIEFYYLKYNQLSYVDNVFYYSINQVTENPLFNWSTNSIIYTGISNFTTALNITTPFIPLLLTYWLIISIVYFLYDIVLIILIVLHKKIHELEESI